MGEQELKSFRARWWHPSGFWTSGRFDAPSWEEVDRTIRKAGGTHVSIETKK